MARNTIFSKQFRACDVRSPDTSRRARSRCPRSRSGRILRFEPLEDRRVLATFTVTNLNDATVTGPATLPVRCVRQFMTRIFRAMPTSSTLHPSLSGDLRLSIAADSAIGLSALLITSPITDSRQRRWHHDQTRHHRSRDAPFPRRARRRPHPGFHQRERRNHPRYERPAGQNGGSAFAGAIYNQGNLQIIASTLYNNAAIGGNAGAGGNSGVGQGGAIFNDGGNVTIRNSTLSGNSAANGSGPVVARSFGGGIYGKNGC